MIRKMNKSLRSRKGFTLIELIVVMAILGILAAIAVPRFSGFTDKAKTSADDQIASIVQNGLNLAISTGEIKVPSGGGSVAVTVSSGSLVFTPTDLKASNGTTDLTAATLKDILDDYIDPSKVLQKYTTITYTITSAGNITVSKSN